MGHIVRSWNVFHGNADPPRRRGYLHEMVRRASADGPDILCLQEVPVWALPRLDDWSRMRAFTVITRLPLRPEGGRGLGDATPPGHAPLGGRGAGERRARGAEPRCGKPRARADQRRRP